MILDPQIVITKPSTAKVTLVEPKPEPQQFELAGKLSESSITDTVSYSSNSSIESSASSSKASPSSLSSQSSVSVVGSSDEPHQLHKICSQQMKTLKDTLPSSYQAAPKQNNPKNLKQISIEEDELKAKFYRLKLDKKETDTANKLNNNSPLLPKKHHQSNTNSHVHFRETRDNFYHPNARIQNHTEVRPCVKNMNSSKTYYNLKNDNNLSNQPCLYAPTLSIKDICSKTKLGNEYSNLCSPHSQELK